MIQGIKTIIYPSIVSDIAQATALYTKLLGTEPYFQESYYVGFKVGDQEIGLDPNGFKQGMTGPVGYWHVSDITTTLHEFGTPAQVRKYSKTSKMSAAAN